MFRVSPRVSALWRKRSDERDIPADWRPVQKQHVHVVDPQVFEALFHRSHEQVLAKIVRMNFGGDAKLIAIDAGRLQRFAGFGFVPIHLSGIKSPVSGFSRRKDCLAGGITAKREGSERALVRFLEIDVHIRVRLLFFRL